MTHIMCQMTQTYENERNLQKNVIFQLLLREHTDVLGEVLQQHQPYVAVVDVEYVVYVVDDILTKQVLWEKPLDTMGSLLIVRPCR